MINNEITLVRKAQAGDETAWRALIDSYYDGIYRMMLHDTGHAEDARELVQEVFRIARERLRKLRNLSSFSSFLNSIARKRKDSLLKARYRSQAFVPEYGYVFAAREKSTKDDPAQSAEFEGLFDGRDVAEFLPPPPYGSRVLAVLRQMKLLIRSDYTLDGVSLRTAAYNAATAARIGFPREWDSEEFDSERGRIKKAFTDWENTPKREELVSFVSRRGFIIWVGASSGSLALGGIGEAFEPLATRRNLCIEALNQLTRPADVIDLLRTHPYSYAERNRLQAMWTHAAQPDRLLDLAIPALLDAGRANQVPVAGMLSNLLDKFRHRWTPDRQAFRHIEEYCNSALDTSCVESIGWVEPLSMALAAFGRPRTHARFLRLAVLDADWRRGNAEMIRCYHGSLGSQMVATKRHLSDRHRVGLQKAADLPILLHLLSTPGLVPTNRHNLKELLTATSSVLDDCAEYELSRYVRNFNKPAC